eukprot:TRINITY_DN945_c0_g1_i2.p1 TRINITY_DN945_c0_g1~~TRINITY_DN945_c0_g1_i2.p1  ORF type:complete len:149 (+),score=28.14 TRINITY_DN945_c0_g1_i2:146-592(+)
MAEGSSSSHAHRLPSFAKASLFALLCIAFLQVSIAGEKETMAAARSFVDTTVEEHPVVIFSKSYCPYCKRAKKILADLGVKPYVVELDFREDGGAIQRAVGQKVGRTTVPQVFIERQHIGGSDDVFEAYESGRLQELLGQLMELQHEL